MWGNQGGWRTVNGWARPAAAGGVGLGLRTNLSAFFELSADGSDSTSNITNLTNNGGATFVSDTIGGVGVNVADLSSAGTQYFSHANSSLLAVNGSDLSVSYWVKFPGGPPGSWLGQVTTSYPQQGWFMDKYFSTANFFRGSVINNNGDAAVAGDSTAAISSSTWYLVVFTFNATTLISSISVNGGALQSGGAMGAGLPSGETGTFYIGNDPSGSFPVEARFARVGKWTGRLLNSTDIAALWNGGAGLNYAGML